MSFTSFDFYEVSECEHGYNKITKFSDGFVNSDHIISLIEMDVGGYYAMVTSNGDTVIVDATDVEHLLSCN